MTTATIPTIRCGSTDVPHNNQRWRTCTNRHPNTNGTSWGWIEGAPGNVCWSNDKSFDQAAAGECCRLHNEWLEEQTPLALRIVKAREIAAHKRTQFNNAQQHADRLRAEFDTAAAEVQRLESLQQDA